MFVKSNKHNHNWLALLFVASVLVNAQATVACAMMSDMSEQMAQCCCGVSHRSSAPTDLVNEPTAADLTDSQAETGRTCDNPRLDCCILEVSVGVNEPPTSDEALTLSSTKVEHQKIYKQLDHFPAAIGFDSFKTQVVNVTNATFATLPEPFFQPHASPLYKTTERYRI